VAEILKLKASLPYSAGYPVKGMNCLLQKFYCCLMEGAGISNKSFSKDSLYPGPNAYHVHLNNSGGWSDGMGTEVGSKSP
jgi:hypothetical protein